MREVAARLRARLRLPFWERADIEAELLSHLQEAEAEFHALGKDEEEARREALARFGEVESVGDALQSIHSGWGGGATVRGRLLHFVFSLFATGTLVWIWWVMMDALRLPWWYAVLWLLTAAAIGLHRMATDQSAGWVWAAFSIVTGPVAWGLYLVLVGVRYLPRPQEREQRLLWIAGLGVAVAVIMIGAPVFALPLEWAGIDNDYARKGMYALTGSDRGMQALFRAARSSRPTLRAAALQELQHGIGSRGLNRASYLPEWTALLRSPDPDVHMAAWNEVLSVLLNDHHSVPPQQLLAAWKSGLTSTDAKLRKDAWQWFDSTLGMAISDMPVRLSPIAESVPGLLALGKDYPEIRSGLSFAISGAIRIGLPGINPDEYGIPPELQTDLPVAPGTIFHGGELSLGEAMDGDFTLEPLIRAVEPGPVPKIPGPPYRATTSSPDLEAWIARFPHLPEHPIVYYVITARGLPGKHSEWIRVDAGNGSRVAVANIRWTTTSKPTAHTLCWKFSQDRIKRWRETRRF